jgi:hypothetical protein
VTRSKLPVYQLREAILGIRKRKLTGKLEINFSQGTPDGDVAWSSRQPLEKKVLDKRNEVGVA